MSCTLIRPLFRNEKDSQSEWQKGRIQSLEVMMDGQREERRHVTLSLLFVFWCFYLPKLQLSAALTRSLLRLGSLPHTCIRIHRHIRSCVLQGVWVWLCAIDDHSGAICCFSFGTAIGVQPTKCYVVSTAISAVNTENGKCKVERRNPSLLHTSLIVINTQRAFFCVTFWS